MSQAQRMAQERANAFATHAKQHQIHLDTVRANCTYFGDTPDGAWGLFVPRDRPSRPGSWLAVHVVRYVLAESREWDAVILTHNGERFGGSFPYFRLREWYPDTMIEWDAALRRCIEA